MKNFKTSANRKVHQRALNAMVRRLNKSLLEDDLWQGRFYVKQAPYTHWWQYEDKSGWNLHVTLEFHDRVTGTVWRIGNDVNYFLMWNGTHLFWDANEFITERVPTWESNPRPGTPEYAAMTAEYVKKGWPY